MHGFKMRRRGRRRARQHTQKGAPFMQNGVCPPGVRLSLVSVTFEGTSFDVRVGGDGFTEIRRLRDGATSPRSAVGGTGDVSGSYHVLYGAGVGGWRHGAAGTWSTAGRALRQAEKRDLV